MYIAIDGGGTKTKYLLLDEYFQVIDDFVGEGTNHDAYLEGWDKIKEILAKNILSICNNNGYNISEIKDIVAGISGIDSETDVGLADKCFHEIGVQRCLSCNDVYLAVKAGSVSGQGIAFNCGTGVCCAGIGKENVRRKCGGLDEWSGDIGGGRWIVVNVFQKVYQNMLFGVHLSDFTGRFLKLTGCSNEEDLICLSQRLRAEDKNSDLVHDIIKFLFDCYDANLPEAVALCNMIIKYAKRNISKLMSELSFSEYPVQVSLTGSILTKAASDYFIKSLTNYLQSAEECDVAVTVSKMEPVMGAVVWLKQRN